MSVLQCIECKLSLSARRTNDGGSLLCCIRVFGSISFTRQYNERNPVAESTKKTFFHECRTTLRKQSKTFGLSFSQPLTFRYYVLQSLVLKSEWNLID